MPRYDLRSIVDGTVRKAIKGISVEAIEITTNLLLKAASVRIGRQVLETNIVLESWICCYAHREGLLASTVTRGCSAAFSDKQQACGSLEEVEKAAMWRLERKWRSVLGNSVAISAYSGSRRAVTEQTPPARSLRTNT